MSKHKNYEDKLNFDTTTEGENVCERGKKDSKNNIWLRIENTNYWIPRAYISLDRLL